MVIPQSVDNISRDDFFELYLKVLTVTLWRGGYPHEIICCMLNKCFTDLGDGPYEDGGFDTSGKMAWPPRRIVKELSDIPLWKLCKNFQGTYCQESSLPEAVIDACFGLLNVKMYVKVNEVINPSDQNARKRWAGILNERVGETTLRDYFGKQPEDNIANWSYQVLRRVKKIMVKEDWLNKPIEDLLGKIRGPQI